jgi:hypothetical protein
MKKQDIHMLVQLREFTRKEFDQIEGRHNPIAQMSARDTARILSSIVKSLDEVLSPYVTIE